MTRLGNKFKYAALTALASLAISSKAAAQTDGNTYSENFSQTSHAVMGNTVVEKAIGWFSDDKIYKEYEYFKSTKDFGNGYSIVSTESSVYENSENTVKSTLHLVGKDGSIVDISAINDYDGKLLKACHNPKKENIIITKAICNHCQGLNQAQKDAVRMYMQNSTKVLNEPIHGTFHSYTQSQIRSFSTNSGR